MKKLLAVLLVCSLLITVASSYAMGLGDLEDLIDSLSKDDPDVGEVLDGFSNFFSGGSSDDSPKSSSDNNGLPSLIGPFSGNTVKVKANNKTYTIHEDFKYAMDKYEEYFDAYIDLVSHPDAPDYMAKYMDFMKKYVEVTEALAKIDETPERERGWTDDETAYYTYVQMEINKKLYSVGGSL